MDHIHDHKAESDYSKSASNELVSTSPALAVLQPPILQLKEIKPRHEEQEQQNELENVQLKIANAEAGENPNEDQSSNPNNIGLPKQLKAGLENLSGFSLDDVKVHYNSSKPAQLQAHAYAQGTDIHLASGQEKHLPHEAWHVVQQKQGRVKPTVQMKGAFSINDDDGLEKEADVMGAKAVTASINNKGTLKQAVLPADAPTQFYSEILWYASVFAAISIPVIIGLVMKYGLQPVKNLFERCYKNGQKDITSEMMSLALGEANDVDDLDDEHKDDHVNNTDLAKDDVSTGMIAVDTELKDELEIDKVPLPANRGVGNWIKFANGYQLAGQQRVAAKLIFADPEIEYVEDFLERCRQDGLIRPQKKWNELEVVDLEQVIRNNAYVRIHFKDANDANHVNYLAGMGNELHSRSANYPNAKIWPSVNHGAIALKAWLVANDENFTNSQNATANVDHAPVAAHEAEVDRNHHYQNPIHAVNIVPSTINGIRVDDYAINDDGIIEFRHFFPI